MAEQIVSSATSAVTSELARIFFSGIVGRLDNRQAADKKLRRLELLLIKVHSAVEASEKHPIENAWLLKWRDTLKVAAAEGDEVLAGFGQPATNPAPAAGDAQQQQEHSSSAAPAPATTTGAASSSARNAPPPSGMAYSIRGASSEDIERLNSAVEKLEELSPEIGDFLKLHKVEVLALTTRKRKRLPETDSAMRMHASLDSIESARRPMVNNVEDSENKRTETTAATNQTAPQEEEPSTLLDRLDKAYATICWSVDLANGRDLRDNRWLARWASILVEAKEQGCAVLGAISARRGAAGAACEEGEECDGDREDSELGRFVCGMESLAGEADYFLGLALLCPWGGDSCRLC
ncbi:unnamed protein product [Urochloa decumbens]|uniref:Rx N-terminal domain-containing protein n=1 Tax=Urochloa decumbens TaxID=240449 RepID=A0ABC9CDX1_9POAL